MISFETVGLKKVELQFDEWTRKFSRPSELLKDLGKKEVERTKKRIFNTKRGPDGKPWAIWDRDTSAERQREGTASTGLLYESGLLHNSIEFDVSHDTLYVGSSVEYAEYLQNGTVDMPARPFLGFNNETENDINWLISTVLSS